MTNVLKKPKLSPQLIRSDLFKSIYTMSKKTIKQKMTNTYLKDRVGELNNITWPTQKQAIHAMILVLIIMLIVGLFLGFVDHGINRVVLFLLNR